MSQNSKGDSDPGTGDPAGSKTGMGIDVNEAYALLIGVGRCEYPKWSLPVTTLDADALRKTLADPGFCAYPADHIRILSDEAATREGILTAVDALARDAETNPNATFLVYYSGHGWRQQTDDGERYFLIPHDVKPYDLASSALPAEDFIQGLQRIQGKRVLVMVDTCHASSMAEAKDPAMASLPDGFAQEPPPKTLVEELGTGEGRAVFLSCRESQKSWILPGEGSLSIFTHHLLAGLQGEGAIPGDTVVTVSGLMGHLSKEIPVSAQRIGREQTPFFKLAAENFPIALLRGGKGLPVESDGVPAREKPFVPGGSSITVGDVQAGRNVIVAHKVGNVG